MAYVQMRWDKFVAEMGDEPGDHQGVVTVYVTSLHGGESEFTLPSADVSVAAEQGCLVGVALKLPDGRRMFVPGSNVTAIIDGPGSKTGRLPRHATQTPR